MASHSSLRGRGCLIVSSQSLDNLIDYLIRMLLLGLVSLMPLMMMSSVIRHRARVLVMINRLSMVLLLGVHNLATKRVHLADRSNR